MFDMSASAYAAIMAHGEREYAKGREACGLIVSGEYIECQNLGEGPDNFRIDPIQWVGAEESGQLQAVVHTHPDQPALPSQLDIERCAASGLPWLIVSVPGGDVSVCLPDQSIHGVHHV